MLREQGSDGAIYDSQEWGAQHRVFGSRDLRNALQIAFRTWRSITKRNATPELRFLQILMDIGLGAQGEWGADPAVLEQLEARLASIDDIAVRNVFAAYLSEP